MKFYKKGMALLFLKFLLKFMSWIIHKWQIVDRWILIYRAQHNTIYTCNCSTLLYAKLISQKDFSKECKHQSKSLPMSKHADLKCFLC